MISSGCSGSSGSSIGCRAGLLGARGEGAGQCLPEATPGRATAI